MTATRVKQREKRSRFIRDGERLVGVETYDVGSSEEHVRWLLAFLRADIDGLTPGGLLDLRAEALRFILAARMDERLHGEPRWPKEEANAAPLLRALQSKLREGFDQLSRGLAWEPFQGNPPDWILFPHPGGHVLRRDIGDAETTFVLNATEVMRQHWPQLRRCKYNGCGVLFLPEHGRQRYDDPACSTKARQERHAPKRKRDYHAEYEARRRRVQPKAKIQRRPRRKKGAKK